MRAAGVTKSCKEIAAHVLREAFPGAHDSVRDGRLSRTTAKEIMREFVREHFPEAICAFGFGSAITSKFRPYSDIDIIVVLPGMANASARWTMYRGFPIDAKSVGRDNLALYATTVATTRQSHIALGLAHGKCVAGDREVGRAIHRQFSRIHRRGPIPPRDATARSQRAVLTTFLVELTTLNKADLLPFVLSSFDMIVNAKLWLIGAWPQRGIWAKRSFGKQHGKAWTDLRTAYVAAIAGDTRRLVRVTWQILEEMGGPLWAGFQAENIARSPKAKSGDP